MPYKDIEQKRAYQRRWVRQKRTQSVTVRHEGSTIPFNANLEVKPRTPSVESEIKFGTAGGVCKFCGVKVSPIANTCRSCSKEHYVSGVLRS